MPVKDPTGIRKTITNQQITKRACRYAGFAGVHALYKDVDSYNRY
jgi:hypothetical protein